MNLKNVALGLMLVGSVFAVGCGDDDGGGDGPSGSTVDQVSTTCDLQSEAGSRTFHVETLRIPTKPNPEAPLPVVGFNIDGLTSTASDLAGCNKPDLTGGIDNGLATIIGGLGPVLTMANVDINEELQTAVTDDAINLDVVIGDWNLTADDACVSITVQGLTAGEAITPLVGRAPMVGGAVALVTFGSDLTISPTFQVSPDGGLGSCTVGCTPINLAITIQSLVARIRLSADLMNVVVGASPNNTNSSMVGGYVRYTGTDAAAFETSLTGLINAIDPELGPTVANIFGQFLDLDSTPSLTACTTVGSGTSADTFSAAILVSSVAPN